LASEQEAFPGSVPVKAEEPDGPDGEENRRGYSVFPCQPDAELELASSVVWDAYGETLAQFLSRLCEEIPKPSGAEKVFKQRVGYLLYQEWLRQSRQGPE